jgi:hypothetical protein
MKMNDDEGEDAGWADEERAEEGNEEADLYGYWDNGEANAAADYHQVQQAMAFQAKRQPQRRPKRPVEAQLREEAQAKHSKAEADQLFPYRDDHPQDPRIMGVDYVVTNDVTYYCSVNLCLLLYRQAQTGQAVM